MLLTKIVEARTRAYQVQGHKAANTRKLVGQDVPHRQHEYRRRRSPNVASVEKDTST